MRRLSLFDYMFRAILEHHRLPRLKATVLAALERGCPRKELIAQYLFGEDREPATFRLDGRQHLKMV